MTDQQDDIQGLRAILFSAIRDVRAGQLDLDKARAINEMSRTLIDTARVEVAYIAATGDGTSAFLPSPSNSEPTQPADDGSQPRNGITGIVRHRLRG